MSTRGFATSARPIATACCSPPDSCAARWRRRSRIHGRARTRARWSTAGRRRCAPTSRFSSTVSDGKSRRPSGTRCHPATRRSLGDRPVSSTPREAHGPARRLVEPGQRSQQGRLAGAVRPDDRVHLAVADLEADLGERPQLTVVDGQGADLEQGRHRPAPASASATSVSDSAVASVPRKTSLTAGLASTASGVPSPMIRPPARQIGQSTTSTRHGRRIRCPDDELPRSPAPPGRSSRLHDTSRVSQASHLVEEEQPGSSGEARASSSPCAGEGQDCGSRAVGVRPQAHTRSEQSLPARNWPAPAVAALLVLLTRTFSKTVMPSNGRGTRNRPSSDRHRRAASSPVTSRPSKQTCPAAGARSPETIANRLVLPAPLGPTMPTASPAPTAMDRSSATLISRNSGKDVEFSSRSGPTASELVARGYRPWEHRELRLLSTTTISHGNVVPFLHWTPTGRIIPIPGCGPLAKSSGPQMPEYSTVPRAAATASLACGSSTAAKASWATSNSE